MSLKTNNSLEYKNTELLTTIEANFKGKLGLARIRLICLFIVALCKVKSVNFSKVSTGFDNCATTSSNYRRIQRFISSVDLKLEWVSKLIFALIPTQESYVLVMDRTNWKFGKQDINILMLGISYKNMCFPILFKMLDKRGNSNTNERKELINTFIDWFGKDRIDCVLADREFVGEDWIRYLNDRQIKYYIRIRNNFKVYLPSKQKEITASHLFNNLKPGQTRQYHKIVRIHNQLCYISGTKVITDGKIDFCIIIGFNKPEKALDTYKIRWQIETLFKAFKSSGFNIEDTHLKKIDRIEKLLMLVMIAFVWCYKIGDYIDTIKPIKIKNHGNRLISVFKLGLDYLSRLLLSKNEYNPLNINCFSFLSCT